MSNLAEAQAVTHQSFFSGKIKEVAAGKPFDNRLMGELIIESSANLSKWLILKEVMGGTDFYSLVINHYVAALASELPELPAVLPLSKDNQKGLEFLRQIDIPLIVKPYARIIEAKLHKTTSELFWRSLISHLERAVRFGYVSQPESDVSPRRQANVMTHNAFRNTELENLHAGARPITAETLTDLEIKTTFRIKDWLTAFEAFNNTDLFNVLITSYWKAYCYRWEE